MARPLKKSGKTSIETGQSNYLTIARYNYTPQEKRILYRVVEQAWEYVKANKIVLTQKPIADIVFRDHVFTMHVTSFMNKEQLRDRGGKQDKDVYDAFASLKSKDISGYNSVNGTWIVASIVNSAYKLSDGMITFSVAGPVWQSALDFSSGWSPIDLTIAMELKSAYSMRFFEIARQYNNTKVWKVSIEEFREAVGCTEKYSVYTDLKRYVIENARKELDKSSTWSFTYKEIRVRKKVVRLEFTFHETNKDKEDPKVLLLEHPIQAYDPKVMEWLKNKLGLGFQQLKSNAKNFYEFQHFFKEYALDELEETFQYIASQDCKPQENIGWFMQNIKKKTENKRNSIMEEIQAAEQEASMTKQ